MTRLRHHGHAAVTAVRAWLGARLVALDRLRLPHWLLVRALPRALVARFDASAAHDLDATLELALRDPHGRPPARYEVRISDGRCAVRTVVPDGANGVAARASISSDDLILLASGTIAWPQLFSSGRFELTGDPFLALRFASLFRLPVELDPVS